MASGDLREIRVYQIVKKLPPGYPQAEPGSRLSFCEVDDSHQSQFRREGRIYSGSSLQLLVRDESLKLVSTSRETDADFKLIEEEEAAQSIAA